MLYQAVLYTSLASMAATVAAQNCTLIPGTIVQPSGQPQVTACANALKLGEICGDDRQCPKDVQCFGSTAGTIRTCGSFNAACTSDTQCATNTCNNGLCNGFKNINSTTTASTSVSSTASTALSSSTAGTAPSGQSPGPAPAGPPTTNSSTVPPANSPSGGQSTNDAGQLIPGGIAIVFGAIIALL